MTKINEAIASGIGDEGDAPKPATLNDIIATGAATSSDARKTRRRPMNGMTEKLKVYGEVPGYHLHIFNDDGNRLVEAQQAGYEFVAAKDIEGTNSNATSYNTDAGGRVRFVVGTGERGDAIYAFLMKIPEEFYKEDQAAIEQRNAQVDTAIRTGVFNEKPNEKRYIPATGITMDSRLYRPS